MNSIRKARLAAGLSQKQVACHLGIASPSVCNWESGKTQPSPDNYKKLADLFGVSVDYLVGREDITTKQPKPAPQETKNEAPPPPPSEIDSAMELLAAQLTPEEVQQVMAFIAGMRAAKGR